jgi:type IV pilus assembly protein PilB
MLNSVTLQDDTPIARFVDKILGDAIVLGASDIHFEIFDGKFVIRYRVDGTLVTLENCEQALARPVFSRLKVLSNLNISEMRVPQDGSMLHVANGNEVELRISCLPTQFGESIVLRVLNNWADFFSLDDLMKDYSSLKNFLKDIDKKSGLTLFVGPTGCGKSTTLYSVLREIKSDDKKILTCEDPVEQRIDGLSQSNINTDIGFTFAAALRAFLRHDPDVIFVGEIRDRETAELAIRAAITGHCVLSTLHANSATGAIPRLIDLGVDRNLIAESLLSVVYQQLEKFELPPQHNGKNPHKRRAVFEALFVNDAIRNAIKFDNFFTT